MLDWLPTFLAILLAILGGIGAYFFSGRGVEAILISDDEQDLTKSTTKLSEKAFEKVWDNDEDSIYDEL